MKVPDYLAELAKEMNRNSDHIRSQYDSHNLSAGENREDLVQKFLKGLLPPRYCTDAGLVTSHTDIFGNQADVLVTDGLNNSPFHKEKKHSIWPIEAVYALIEVKTSLQPRDLQDAIAKGRRFKSLERRFSEARKPKTNSSLFVIWGFEGPKPDVLKRNLIHELMEVPTEERPDLVVIPHKLVATSGYYLETVRLGEVGSSHRNQLQATHGESLSGLLPEGGVEVWDLGSNALLAWLYWFQSWLDNAGERTFNPFAYLGEDQNFGTKV